jgi:hypothetical protein
VAAIERPNRTIDPLRLFADEHGFFRSARTDAPQRDPLASFVVEPGPEWPVAEAHRQVRRYLDLLADGRPLLEEHDDPLEYAQRNGLLLLIGPVEEERLEDLYTRMPPDMAEAWREALRGGAASDAFGPLSEPERLDEARIEAELRSGDTNRRRAVLVGAGAFVLVALVVGIVAIARRGGGSNDVGTIRFGDVVTKAGPEQRDGPPPAVEKALVARLDRPVAVSKGSGDVQNRIVVNPPASDLPQPPNTIAATLFRYNGRGQVVLVGPANWFNNACVQVSVISAGLRPFDTSYFEGAPSACGGHAFGRVATVGCRGADTLMLDLVIPEGQVGLEEGGTASVSAVRIVLRGNAPAYESISLNGQIAVAAGSTVAVPTFGGPAGSTARFDVSPASGAPLVGSCVLS